mgnify:CR=1 FL=1
MLRDTLVPASIELADGSTMNVFQHVLTGFEKEPYFFRVLAANTAGLGPLSGVSNPVTESCAQDQFLQTHLGEFNMTCASCPSGAFCGGLRSENVTARDGFWRIPWSPHALSFVKCPAGSSCLGWKDSMLFPYDGDLGPLYEKTQPLPPF